MKNIAPVIWNPPDVVRRCQEFGRYVVDEAYVNKFSTDLSSHGAQYDAGLQTRAREAECAACNWIGVGIDELNWTHPDTGFDIDRGIKSDVKSTEWGHRFLLWPLKKNHLFDGKDFDVLILGKVRSPLVRFPGWLTKREFRDMRQTADGSNGLTKGTWFVPEDLLHPMVELHGLLARRRIPRSAITPYEDPAYAVFDQQRN